MVIFIDQHREVYGVEPICAVLPIAPSPYWWHRTRQADPTQRSRRAHGDDRLRPEIQRIWDENEQVYGAEKSGSSSVGTVIGWRVARSNA